MAHRFNVKTGRVEPKPSARERTWYRWRLRYGIETPKDNKRFKNSQEVKESIRQHITDKLQDQYDSMKKVAGFFTRRGRK